jgi:ABC-type multidrug transport system ATPase subunit
MTATQPNRRSRQPDRVRVAGHDPARDPDSVRAVIGVTGQLSAVDNLLTGEENLILVADLHHLGRTRGRHAGRWRGARGGRAAGDR